MLSFDRSHQVHFFKFEVWKNSMMLRAYLDIAFALFVVIWFQVGLIDYAYLLLHAKKFGREIICNKPEFAAGHFAHETVDYTGDDGHGGGHGDDHHRLLASAAVKNVCDGVASLTEEEIEYEMKVLKYDIIGVEHDLFRVLAISYLNLLFPLNLMSEYILTSRTKRLSQESSFDFYNELILFCVTLWL